MSSLSPNGKKMLLNVLNINTIKLHSGYPGVTGANEVSGGTPAYAPKPCAFGLSSAGEPRLLSAPVVFDVPASSIEWATLWRDSTQVWMAPTTGSPVEFATDLTANTVKVPSHGLANGDKIVFFSTSPPGGLVAGTIYFVVTATTDDFQVAATAGGSAINLTTTAAADCLVSRIVPRVYAAQDTHTVSAYAYGLPY